MGHCPGETGSLYSRVYGDLSPSRSGPETGFVAIVLFLSLSYCLSNNELRRLASYYATSNFYVHEFSAFAPYVTHTTINERTHTSLYVFVKTYVCMYVCMYVVCMYVCMSVHCTFGHLYMIVTKRAVRSF